MAPTKLAAFAAILLAATACNKSPNSPKASADPKEAANTVQPVFTAVNEEIQAGKYDDAAAKLMGLRASAHSFNDKEATAFRDSMNRAYSAAVEAAAKGDPRGKVALEMLRASGNH